MKRNIPGLSKQASTDLPVLLPIKPVEPNKLSIGFCQWFAGIPVWFVFLIVSIAILLPSHSLAQSNQFGIYEALEALWRWIPFLLKVDFYSQ